MIWWLLGFCPNITNQCSFLGFFHLELRHRLLSFLMLKLERYSLKAVSGRRCSAEREKKKDERWKEKEPRQCSNISACSFLRLPKLLCSLPCKNVFNSSFDLYARFSAKTSSSWVSIICNKKCPEWYSDFYHKKEKWKEVVQSSRLHHYWKDNLCAQILVACQWYYL